MNETTKTTMTAKQKMIITICALAAVVITAVSSVFVTVALLTSSAAVSNVFTIGTVGITMTESKVNPNGQIIDGGTQVDTNTYHLVPNKTYVKDPRITVNAGSEKSYLFVLVRNDLALIEDKTDASNKPTIAQQLEANGWEKYTKASTGWVYTWVGAGNVTSGDAAKESGAFAGNALTVQPGDYQLFTSFSVDEHADVSTYGAAKITLTAVAIQDSGFENNVDAAWQAVLEKYSYIYTGNN